MGALLPAMTQKKLDTQRDVVKNERRWSVDNQPYGTCWEKIQELSYPETHPFHHSLIGSMEHLSNASLDDVAQFFRTYYTPDNAVLSIAGDFEIDEAKELVAKYFGDIPRGKERPPLSNMELPLTFGKAIRSVVEDDVSLARVYISFRSPIFGSEEYYAASVAGAILGMRRGSRLYRSLVRERQVAADAAAFTFDLAKGADLLIVDVTARPDVSAEKLEQEVVREIDLMINDGVSAEEVARAVALIQTDMITAMQTASERADRLSMFATLFGDAELVNEQADRYAAVTAKQVNAFARERFIPENRATLIYVPRTVDPELANVVESSS
jgi:predicted Zn-dependent peptidase